MDTDGTVETRGRNTGFCSRKSAYKVSDIKDVPYSNGTVEPYLLVCICSALSTTCPCQIKLNHIPRSQLKTLSRIIDGAPNFVRMVERNYEEMKEKYLRI